MLHVPAPSRPTFTIVGLDPGTHNLGLGAIFVDMNTYKVVGYECYTLQATKLMHETDMLVGTHGYTFARVDALKDAILRHLIRLQPSVIASEDAYFSRRFPGAFAPLLQSINGIRQAVLEYNPYMPFTLIEPSVIKSAVGAKGAGNNKGLVLEAMQRNPEFNCQSYTPLHLQTEHAIDATAIAYTRLKQIR